MIAGFDKNTLVEFERFVLEKIDYCIIVQSTPSYFVSRLIEILHRDRIELKASLIYGAESFISAFGEGTSYLSSLFFFFKRLHLSTFSSN